MTKTQGLNMKTPSFASKAWTLCLLLFSVLTAGCQSLGPIKPETKRVFTYDFQIPDKTKQEIYNAAFTFIAMSYGDSNRVLKITDKESGLIAGKGISVWSEIGTNRHTPHEFKFMAKTGRARLQLSIPGTAQASSAGGVYLWPLPTPGGYEQIVQQFNSFSQQLDSELKGNTKSSSFSDF